MVSRKNDRYAAGNLNEMQTDRLCDLMELKLSSVKAHQLV